MSAFKVDKEKLYTILDVPKDADSAVIKKAYRKLAMVLLQPIVYPAPINNEELIQTDFYHLYVLRVNEDSGSVLNAMPWFVTISGPHDVSECQVVAMHTSFRSQNSLSDTSCRNGILTNVKRIMRNSDFRRFPRHIQVLSRFVLGSAMIIVFSPR